jgi:drug/metabolite transporter (DMT)-like permease
MGYLAMGLTVMIWSGFALSARASEGSALAVADVAMIRVLVPSLILLPFLPSRLAAMRRAGLWTCVLMACGAGVPFIFLAAYGGAEISAAHVGALIAGTASVSVAILTLLTTGRRPERIGALALILGGAVALIGSDGGQGSLGGVGLLLVASLFWGAYTLALRRSGLDPIGSALMISLPGVLGLVPLMAVGVVPSQIGVFGWSDALPFLLMQGLGVGVVSSLTYAFAIRHIGAERASTIGALSPALTAVLAAALLHEPLGAMMLGAVALICCGVLMANRPKRTVTKARLQGKFVLVRPRPAFQ